MITTAIIILLSVLGILYYMMDGDIIECLKVIRDTLFIILIAGVVTIAIYLSIKYLP